MVTLTVGRIVCASFHVSAKAGQAVRQGEA